MTYEEFLENFMGSFLKIETFKGKQDFANQNLNRIGSGSGRIVYDIDGTKVFKLAKNPKGIAQNEVESNIGKYEDVSDIVTEVFKSDYDDSWLIAEEAKKVTDKRIRELTGIPSLNELYYYLRNNEIQNQGYKYMIFHQDPNMVEELNENEFVQTLSNFIANYNQTTNDMGRPSTYGEVLRDGQPTIVLTDYGLNDEVYETHYNPRRKGRMFELYNFADGNDDILSDIGSADEIRHGMWAQMPYSVSDGDGVINEDFIQFVSNRDYYPSRPLSAMPYLMERFHECVNNIKEVLDHVDNKKHFYKNLLKLQEYLIKQNHYNRDPLMLVERDVNQTIKTMDRYYDRRTADKLANKVATQLGYGTPKYMGSGGFGVAYDIGNNRVLKITKDYSEAYENLKLIGKSLKYIAQPYNVFSIESETENTPETYVIILEKLRTDNYNTRGRFTRLDDGIRNAIGLTLVEVFEHYIENQDYDFIEDDLDNYLNSHPNEKTFYNDLMDIAFEAKRNKIKSMDYLSPSNLGYKQNGDLAFFDVGYGDESAEPDAPVLNLNETSADVGLDREKSNRIADEVAKNKHYNAPSYIGQGEHGFAYNIGNNMIMKVTSDKSEAVESLKIKDKNPKHIANIYNVFEIKPEENSDIPISYVIISEELIVDQPHFERMVERLDYAFEKILGIDFYHVLDDYTYYPDDTYADNKNKIDKYLSKNPEDAKFYYGLLAIADEAKKYGIISKDFYTLSNLGYKKDGSLGFFDMGYGDKEFPYKTNLEKIEVAEDGSAKFSTVDGIGRDEFPPYETNDSSPVTDNNVPTTTDEITVSYVSDMTDDTHELDEDLEYSHASDATQDEYTIDEEVIPFSSEGDFDDEEDFERDQMYQQAYDLVPNSGINILSGKELSGVVINNGVVVGAIFTELNNFDKEFSFDVIVDKNYRGSGIGKELVKYGVDEYNSYQDMFDGELKLKLDVVNPYMRDLLKKYYNFKDTEKIGNDRYIMSMNERELSAMKGSSTVNVKKKCRLGGLGNTSAACNQGDISNLEIKSLDETIPASDAYRDESVLQTIIDGRRDMGLIAFDFQPHLRNIALENDFKIIPIEQSHHNVGMGIVYRDNPNGLKRAKRLLEIMNSHGGYVKDETPEEAREIGELFNYDEESINDYINRNYGEKTNEEILNEETKEEFDYYDLMNTVMYETLESILKKEKIKFELINPQQYKAALDEFIRYGEFIRFPAKYVYQWKEMVLYDIVLLSTLTQIHEHTQYFPFQEFYDIFGIPEEEQTNKFDDAYEILEDQYDIDSYVPFFSNGHAVLSDYGVEPLFKLAKELLNQKEPEEIIVTINKILDVAHQRSDLAELFERADAAASIVTFVSGPTEALFMKVGAFSPLPKSPATSGRPFNFPSLSASTILSFWKTWSVALNSPTAWEPEFGPAMK